MMTDIQSALKSIIEEAVPGLTFDPIQDGDRTLKELGIDSLDKMSILLAVQERWNKEFSEAEINAMNTVNDMCKRVA